MEFDRDDGQGALPGRTGEQGRDEQGPGRHGYAAGTTNRIAEAAGHSIGSLYQYFPNKDAILVELAAAHARAGVAAIGRLLDDGPLPERLENKLRLFVRAALDSHRDDPALHRVLFEQAPRPPELLDFLQPNGRPSPPRRNC